MSVKVCHISDCHAVNDNRIFLKECTSLAREGYDVSYIAVGNSDNQNGVTRIGIKKRGVIGRLFVTRMDILHVIKGMDLDIVHLHDPTLLFLVKYFKRKGKKVIYDSHEDYYLQIQNKGYIPKFLRLRVARVYRSYLKQISEHLDGFIFPADNHFIDVKNPVTVVGNSPEIKPNNQKTPSTPISQRSRTICYVGGLTESRGITNLIKVAFLVGCRLILAGKYANEEYQQSCEKMEEYSVVDYRGVVDHDEISSIINESRIGMAVLLNIGQYGIMTNLATKTTEYCAQGLPVFLNRTKFNESIVAEYNFGVCIDPEDIEGYANTLCEYLDNPVLLEKLGANGRQMVEEKYNWKNDFNNLKALYSSLEK